MGDTNTQVIVERINNLKEFFKEEFEKNSVEHKKMEDMIVGNEMRIRALEDWKLVFVAKYSVYSAVALFFGSLVATLGMNMIRDLVAR
jgi:hypothetical protein